MARLLSAAKGTEYFLASLISLPSIEKTGRRKLMMIGAFGMSISMAMLADSVSASTEVENGAPQLETRYGVTATVFLFVFHSFFANGLLALTWLYLAEITNIRIRIQANALSTSCNWMSNFLIVKITPRAFKNLGYHSYIMFAVFNAALIHAMYFFFPDTKERTLEELDIMFASANAKGISPVKHSLEMPHLSGPEVDRGCYDTLDRLILNHENKIRLLCCYLISVPRLAGIRVLKHLVQLKMELTGLQLYYYHVTIYIL